LTESSSFNFEEAKIYDLKKIRHKSNKEISEITKQPVDYVEKILGNINKKVKQAENDLEFYRLVSNYLRLLKLTKKHYQEVLNNDNHVFNIDFSEIYVYLTPMYRNDKQFDALNNVGCINFMFDSKRVKHDYCVLPPAALEILFKVGNLYVDLHKKSDFDKLMADMKMQKLSKLMKGRDKYKAEEFGKKLMLYYNDFKLSGILAVAEQKIDDRLLDWLERLKSMHEEKIIKPLDGFVGDDVTKVEINQNIYEKAFTDLEGYRPAHTPIA